MNSTVDALHAKLHILKEQGQDWLQHSNTMRKIHKSKRYLQKHAMLFTVLGIISFLILSPFLLISLVVMAPLVLLFCSVVALLIMSFSFVFGFLLNCSLVVFAVVASCYILYCISWFAVCCVQTSCIYIKSRPSQMCHYFRTRIREFFWQLLDGLTSDLTQQSNNVQKHSGSNDSSDLEDIQPDFRDREAKLYEALVSKPQNTDQDTFEPSQY